MIAVSDHIKVPIIPFKFQIVSKNNYGGNHPPGVFPAVIILYEIYPF